MVIGQGQAVARSQVLAIGVQTLAIVAPGCVAAPERPLGQWSAAPPLDRIGNLAIDHHVATLRLQLFHVRRALADLGVHALMSESARVPARYAGHAILSQHSLQRLRRLGKLVAQLETRVADSRTFGQGRCKRRVAA
ncbi:hypothetical protein D3C72_1585190 [compost metagenome]